MRILTFDLEDWFHINFEKTFNNESAWKNFPSRIENNVAVILDILNENNVKATFFCLGWVVRKYPHIIKHILKNGHDIGSHSDIHNLITKQNQSEFEADLHKSIESIEDLTGEKVRMFRAPAFSIGINNLWAFESLVKKGIEIDCSIFPAFHHFGGFPELKAHSPCLINYNNVVLKEFPVSTTKFLWKSFVLSGGGYFRFFPYCLINAAIMNSNYVITYFHPRDIDANQPLLEGLSPIRRFKSYYGLKTALPKFKNLLQDFEFINISQADTLMDWEKSIKYSL